MIEHEQFVNKIHCPAHMSRYRAAKQVYVMDMLIVVDYWYYCGSEGARKNEKYRLVDMISNKCNTGIDFREEFHRLIVVGGELRAETADGIMDM